MDHAHFGTMGSSTCRDCKIESIERFGLLVEILLGKTGLVHTSELDVDRTVSPDAFTVGDRIDVKCLEVTFQRIALAFMN